MSYSTWSGRYRGWALRLAVVTAMMAASGVSVRAAGAEELRCQIPFSFVVNSKTLPPGNYHVDVDVAHGMVELRDLSHGAFALGIGLDDPRTPETKLVFHRYGRTARLEGSGSSPAAALTGVITDTNETFVTGLRCGLAAQQYSPAGGCWQLPSRFPISEPSRWH